ncbi:MAG: rod-binding protein [Alphaproteobacteria bacterium]|nr:rod-binding protein [Alphaproteobacteria bacterium]
MNLGSLDLANANFAATQPKLPSAKGNFDKTARDFEAVFIAQMFEQMWSEVKTDGPMGGGTGEKIFRSMMIQDIGKQIADQGGMGLASMVKRELLAIQEGKRQ